MATEYAEKRRFPRYPCDTGVLIHLDEGSGGGFWGTLSDICVGGCYIYTFSPLPVGKPVQLGIKANGKEIDVKGTTVSCHPGVGMGVSFTSFINLDCEQTLKSYIAELASRPQDNNQVSGIFH
ncbi:MAG TPA: PilZ domain-containing protein [Candidatus Angelobacter sp.]|nr:PilZ domain-containing protein [Candidatus Angelobacter sp.]